MIIEQIQKYMDESEWGLFNESLALMRSKAATAERLILKALDKSQEEACRVIARQDMFHVFYLRFLWAIEGRWDETFLLFYLDVGDLIGPDYVKYQSEAHFQQYREKALAKAEEDRKAGRFYYQHLSYLRAHELEPVRQEGFNILADYRRHGNTFYAMAPDFPGSAPSTCRLALLALSLGLHEQAAVCINTLQSFLEMVRHKRPPESYRPESFEDVTDFLHYLYLARTCGEAEAARRHALRAVNAYLKAVLRKGVREDDRWDFMTISPVPALCVLIEFDFDEAWAKACCHNLYRDLISCDYEQFFLKAQEWNIWTRMPESIATITPAQIEQIKTEEREKKKK